MVSFLTSAKKKYRVFFDLIRRTKYFWLGFSKYQPATAYLENKEDHCDFICKKNKIAIKLAELIVIKKKKTDKIVEQTNIAPEEILEAKLNKTRVTFSFNFPWELEEEKVIIEVLNLERFNSIHSIIYRSKFFKIFFLVFLLE